MANNQLECINPLKDDFSYQIIRSIFYNFSLSFFPAAVSDYLKIKNIINTQQDYLCKQVVAISMLYFIKKNFYEFCEVVFLFQMTTLLSSLLISKGANPYLSKKFGELLRLYIRFHSHIETATGICIMLISILAGTLGTKLENKLITLFFNQETTSPNCISNAR